MPKTKQINVSIPEEIDAKITERITRNKEIYKRMGLRTRAQIVSAILENGIVGFDRIADKAKEAIEAENQH